MSPQHRAQHRAAPAPVRTTRRGRVAILLTVVLLMLGIIVGAGAYAVSRLHFGRSGGGTRDYAGGGTGRVVVQVHTGDSATSIGQTLVTDGVVASVSAFTTAAENDVKSASIQPGSYALRSHMSAAAALQLLLTATTAEARFTVPEGTSIKKLPGIIAAHTAITAAAVQAAIDAPATLGLPPYAQGHVEGFLFPATYDVLPGASASQVLTQMTARFAQAAVDTGLVAKAAALGLTPLQAVTIASVIQRESASAADGPKVARVFYNRLKAGMGLGSEFTVAYAGGDASSPYDTYTHKGIPPGAYDSPGETALMSALNPAAGPYLYFVTLPKEGTQYGETDAQFTALQQRCMAEGGCKS